VIAALREYAWPGNVRELKNLMERLVIMVDRVRITAADVTPLLGGAAGDLDLGGTLAERLEAFERRLLSRALDVAGGNVAETARSLGLDRANLHRKLRRLGLHATEGE
jgi:two-component system nitrogen regulation response regulator NtrX